MPLLDIQSRVEPDNRIVWKYFEKDVTSPFTILNTSALPQKVKRMSLIQEGLRRLRNTCPALVQELKQELNQELNQEELGAELLLYRGECRISQKTFAITSDVS